MLIVGKNEEFLLRSLVAVLSEILDSAVSFVC